MALPRFQSSELILKHTDPHKIKVFLDLIEETNSKINIVSRETSREKLFALAADCLVPLEFGVELGGSFFDIGPGGGFPSVVLMLAYVNLRGTLIERTTKKAEFLGRAIKELGLDAKVIPEDFSEAVRRLPPLHYSFGTMKYVRLDRKILRGVTGILHPGGKFLYYSRFEEDSLALPEFMSYRCYRYYLDDTDNVRTLTVFSLTSR